MAFAVTEFKSNLKQGGARPSLFRVIFDYPTNIVDPPTKASFLVKATTIPASTIGAYDVYYHGKAIKVAGDRAFDTWDTTIINDEDFGIRNKMMEWMRWISGKMNGERTDGYGGDGIGDVGEATVTQLGTNGKELQSYKMYSLWPSELGEIAVDWSSDAMQEYTIGFAYDYWSSGTGSSPSNSLPPPPIGP